MGVTKRKDPVTVAVREAVLRRDGGCVAAVLDRAHVCRDRWGRSHASTALSKMTVDHVKDQPMMGKRAPSDPEHLATLCWEAHVNTRWATSHRPELREYLARFGPRSPLDAGGHDGTS